MAWEVAGNFYTVRYVHWSMAARASARRILDRALNLFSCKGYDASSVREICEASGLTKPTLYHFYGSKEGVYRALVDGALEDFRKTLATGLAEDGPIEERLKRVARAYFRHGSENRELSRFIFGLIYSPPSSAPATDFPRFYQEIVGLVAQAVDLAVTRGELAPGSTELRMLTFMGALGEALSGFVVVGQPELTPDLADAIVDSLFAGWRSH